MTNTTGKSRHPDVSEIADLGEGLLSATRTTELLHHLDNCSPCAEINTSLEQVRELLGTLPAPEIMPTDVAGRIDAALAAERPAYAAPHGTAHVSRETSPTTAKDVASISRPTGRPGVPTGRPGVPTGRGRPGVVRRRRAPLVTAILGTAAIGAGVVAGIYALHPFQGSDSYSAASDVPRTASAKRSTDFSELDLQEQVDLLLAPRAATSEKPKPGDAAPQNSTANTPMIKPLPAVPPCVQRGTESAEQVLAAEAGMYKGASAYLLVLASSAESHRVHAYVIDATCVDATPAGKGKVLLTHSYPRP